MGRTVIRIRGARTHNLKSVDVDFPEGLLVAVTGVSGSGKSSLVFDTLFAESQRQYIESLSIPSRHYLEQLPRPDVDSLDGVQPTLCIDQRPGRSNPRSTVGTITEVYDYLRLLYARCGTVECYGCGAPIASQSSEQILKIIGNMPLQTRLVVLSPMVRGQKGSHREVLSSIRNSGLVRVRIDGETFDVEAPPSLDPNQLHTIEAIVDRIVLKEDSLDRLADAVELAIKLGHGRMAVSYLVPPDPTQEEASWQERLFSTQHACPQCGINYAEVEPRTFSFNSPYGACEECRGVGFLAGPEKPKGKRARTDGDEEESVPNEGERKACPACDGTRLRKEALAVKLFGKSIIDFSSIPLQDAAAWLGIQDQQALDARIAAPLLQAILSRLEFLMQVGVGYLSLDRTADTLSGGELQRVRLATSIGSGLVGICYVLDEPSIGLHPRDSRRLYEAIRGLQSKGNTILLVEHDEDFIRHCDWIVDIGPRAGVHGGRVVACGKPNEISEEDSITAKYLRGSQSIPLPAKRRRGDAQRQIRIRGASTNNLKSVDVDLPLGVLVGITGVSGSGKSSLIQETLVPSVRRLLHPTERDSQVPESVKGLDGVDKLISIDQKPIGRSPRSTPATYSGIFDELRELFAVTRDAKQRGFTSKRFSFNAGSGRCESCQGQGVQRVDMGFLADIFVACHACHGTRFNRQTLQVRYKGKNIADCLAMTVSESLSYFENIESIARVLRCMDEVGLGYLQLGQHANTLSGGESQRVKLATELSRLDTGSTLYVLDEPTTGLHMDDVCRLIEVLQKLVDKGNTVIVVEHHLDVIKCCDWLVDLGPEGGSSGGRVVAEGTPEKIAGCRGNATGDALSAKLASSRS